MWLLLWENLTCKRVRLILTVASVAVAFILFALAESFRYALVGGIEVVGEDRLITSNKVAITQPIPAKYLQRILTTPGVKSAVSTNWLGGYYQEESNTIISYGIQNGAQMLDVYPEMELPSEEFQNWLRERTGALVGRTLAEAQNWKVGDVIPMRSNIWLLADGSNTWEMKITGIFDITDTGDSNRLYYHYDYYNEASLQYGADQIAQVISRVENKNQLMDVAQEIDALFANSDTETKTISVKAATQGYVNQIGDIGHIVTLIVGAVFITILLVTANTMSQAIRERTSELAVLKTLGFSRFQVTELVMRESLTLIFLGGVIGLILGTVLVQVVGDSIKQHLPMMVVPLKAYVVGLLLMLFLSVLSGLAPAISVWRMKITTALRHN